jgi:hypothetical protein
MIIRLFHMKKIAFFQICLLAGLTLGFFAFTARADGMDAKPGAASSETNTAPAEAPIPLSVFDTSQPYKDPFFPNSTRKRIVAAAPAVVVSPTDASQYALKGISGVQGQEVVIINNRNAAVGERVDVTLLGGGTFWITVTKIDQHSATIIPDGQQPIVISLPKEDW